MQLLFVSDKLKESAAEGKPKNVTTGDLSTADKSVEDTTEQAQALQNDEGKQDESTSEDTPAPESKDHPELPDNTADMPTPIVPDMS